MQIRKFEKKGVTVLTVDGQIDVHTSPKLRLKFDKLYAQGVRKMVIDFEKVTYVDSSGLAALIYMIQKLRQNKGAMALANLLDKINYLFEITKIDMLMSIYQTQEEAIASL